MSSRVYKLSELEGETIERMPTGFLDLDLAYGKTHDDRYPHPCIGLPRGKVSLWAGSAGVGKSRVAKAIGMNMCGIYGYRVLYILNEDAPSSLVTMSKNYASDNFFVMGSPLLEDHEAAIEDVCPVLVIVGSLTGLDKIESSSTIRSTMKKYKDMADRMDCHIVLIAHLAKDGSVKGNNDVTYYPDLVAELKPLREKDLPSQLKYKGLFMIKIIKNRGGPVGSLVCFQHNNEGVVLRTSAIVG